MKTEKYIYLITRFFLTKKETVTLTFLNVRSFNRHVADIMNDRQLRENDILCLTETRILPNENTYPTALQSQFLSQFNSSENKFCNIACVPRLVSIL